MLALRSRAAQKVRNVRNVQNVPNVQTPGSCRRIARSARPAAAAVAAEAAARSNGHVHGHGHGRPLWDEAVESLKAALQYPLAATARPPHTAIESEFESIAHIPLESLPSDLDWPRLTRVAGMDLADDQRLSHRIHSRAYDDPMGDWDDLRWDSRLPDMQQLQWPANTGHRLRPYNLPPQSLWALDLTRLAAMRRRHSWKKLNMQELSTALLIHSLLRRVAVPARVAALSPQIARLAAFTRDQARAAREDILDHIARLHLEPVDAALDDPLQPYLYPDQPAVPRYHQDPDGDFYETTHRLNTGLKALLHHESRSRKHDRQVAVATAKICHNLLVSSAPPDVQTFNILLAGFKRWRRPDMVDDVIPAFHASKIRPNEITLRSILGHYISEGRPDSFSRFVAKMRGTSDALMLAHPEVAINEASQGRLIRKDERKVYQKIYPTPMVFGALVGGVLKFGGFERALDVYYEMKADGWGLDMPGLTRLLGDCIRRADWQGGVYIWAEIGTIKEVAMPKDMAKAYEFMLSLCSVTGKTSAFNQLLQDIATRGYDRHAIISGAEKTTRWARAKKSTLAPAWAADNLLIAVSGFVKDSKEPEPNATPDFSIDDLMYGQSTVQGDSDMPIDNLSDWCDDDDDDDAAPVGVSEQTSTDPNETWASWVEAEFGERPSDPDAHDWLATTTSKPVREEQPDPTASKEAWERWMKAEFGSKPNDSNP